MHYFPNAPRIDFHPGLNLLNAGVLSGRHFNRMANDGVRMKTLEYMPLTTEKKMIFYV